MSTRIAILDLYDGYPNEGMRCIKSLTEGFFKQKNINGSYEVFDVRGQNSFPEISQFDLFIGSGGPGSPIFQGEEWELSYADFLKNILQYNEKNDQKKHLLLICHSFQIMVQAFGLGVVCKRKSTSFGVMPVHQTPEAATEPLFEGLQDPFWAVDSRDYQVIHPDHEHLDAMGGKILALEKERPHLPYERAIMGMRLSPEVVGFQFHPEADAEGMMRYFQQEDKKMAVVNEHGEEKFLEMIDRLDDPDKILLTEATIIPKFLELAYTTSQEIMA